MLRTSRPERPGLVIGAAAAVAAALLVALLSLALPGFLAKGYDQKSRDALRKESQDVRAKFGRLLGSLESRKKGFTAPLPADPAAVFSLLKGSGLDPETEGVAHMNGEGNLDVWYGNVVNLIDIVSAESFRSLKSQTAAFLIKSKASVYLVAMQDLGHGQSLLAHFRLLAFVPQFQSSYILEYQALSRAGHGTFDVVYWDFAEDVSGFEKFFVRNHDEFVGQPRRENEIQTLFFPLRNQAARIVATVTLSSPSLTSKLTTVREDLHLVLFFLAWAAGFLALIALWTSPGFRKKGQVVPGLLIVAVSIGLRMAAIPLVQLGRVRVLSVFSPMAAGFATLGTLTRSPADMLLTALMLFSVAACLVVYARRLGDAANVRAALPLAVLVHIAAAGLAVIGLTGFQGLVRAAVSNANIALLRWSVDAPALFMHLSLLLCLATAAAAVTLAFRLAVLAGRSRPVSGLLLLALSAAGLAVLGGWRSPLLFVLDMLLLGWTFALAGFPPLAARREFAFLGLLLAALWMTAALESLTLARSRTLLETTLKRTIQSQEPWGNFLMEESFPEIDRAGRAITAFFTNPADSGYAHGLWQKTLVAKFNWYSSLELRDAEGNILSRFSLNVPKFYGQQPELEPSEGWTVVRQTMNFIGKEMEFLVGYRDWKDEGRTLGRLILYVSMDPEMLPFLYSANPYFEVLRTDPMPSLNQFDFGCAIYDLDGTALFNPQKLTAGMTPQDLERLNGAAGGGFWSRFVERGTAYDTFLFRERDRCYSLFTPVKKLKTRAVEFLRLFFIYLLVSAAVLLTATLVRGKAKLHRPLWSFSNRVYAAFLAVALIPLVMYSFFTRNLFDRIFTQRFVEDAAIHASFAKGLMEAFLVIQGTEVSPYLAPSEDLALWISSTLANDVTLYSDGIVVASSRREFFDTGLLPDLLDGAAYESLVYERKPYFTERRTIGGYSFQNLTVPYEFRNTTLFISLPFPFERQEVARATREIVEFLVLLAAFFLVLVILFSRGIRSMIIVPVRKLVAGTREVGLGNLEVTIDHRSRDEMMTLIEGFNTMIKNLKAHEQELAEMSKKVAWTEMARKVAHEIKNPLTPIQLSAEHVLKVYEDKKGDFDRALRESMSYIISEVENLRRIAQEFMEISRDTTLAMEPLDLKEVLDETLRPYRRLLSERIRFKAVYSGPDFVVRGDAAKLRMAFRNVIANAIEAISQKGEVSVTVGRERSHVTVAIRDTGQGMTRETIERIFDPYFSTKDAGTGLGLPIAKKIIEEHGGTIHVESEPGLGTTVTVRLPVG